jgi:hypothetical protein
MISGIEYWGDREARWKREERRYRIQEAVGSKQ